LSTQLKTAKAFVKFLGTQLSEKRLPYLVQIKGKARAISLECKNLCNFSSVFGGTLVHSQSVISCVQEVPVLKNEMHTGAGFFLSPKMPTVI
jgi:hypothetical protein